MHSRLGLFFNMFEQLLSIAPEELYQYLSTNSDHLLASFASNFDKISILNIFRLLLDTPISSTLSDGSILEGPWWHDSNHLLALLLESLASPDCAPNVELLFYTILTRGLPLEFPLFPFSPLQNGQNPHLRLPSPASAFFLLSPLPASHRSLFSQRGRRLRRLPRARQGFLGLHEGGSMHHPRGYL